MTLLILEAIAVSQLRLNTLCNNGPADAFRLVRGIKELAMTE